MKVRIYTLVAAMLCCSAALAQENVPVSEALQLLSQPRSADVSGMAGAGSASVASSAAMAVFDNPARLVFAPRRMDAAVSYNLWAPGNDATKVSYMGGGVAVKLGKGFAVGAGALYGARPSLDFGGSYGTYAPSDLMVAGGVSVAFTRSLSLGASVRFAQQQLMPDYKISSVAFSAMLQYRLKALNVAAGVQNLGGGVKSESGNSSPLPASAHAAVSYQLPFGLGAALDADYYFSGKVGVSAGLRYTFRELLYVRAGYRFASKGAALPSHLALGLGARWKGIGLDVTYITANKIIGNSLAVSLGYRF